jgi:hypothetical protein
MVNSNTAGLAMSAAATCPLMDLLLHEALRLARIMHPTIAPLKIALRKDALKTHIPKRRALKKIVAHTAISLVIRRSLTSTTMTRGLAMILAATMPTIMSIILGNMAASLVDSGASTSTALAGEVAIASGLTIFISASRRMTTITSMIGIGTAIPS